MENETITIIPNKPCEIETRFDFLFNNNCNLCGNKTTKQDTFYRLTFKYCSSKCVQDHRKSLEKVNTNPKD